MRLESVGLKYPSALSRDYHLPGLACIESEVIFFSQAVICPISSASVFLITIMRRANQ